MDEKQKIIQEIQRMASSIAPKRISSIEFYKNSSVSKGKLRYHFGSWNEALSVAGLEPNPSGIHISGYKKFSDDELLEEIGRLWKKTGFRPTGDLMNSEGKFSQNPYKKRWGKWSTAINEFIKRFGVPSIVDIEGTQTPNTSPKTEKPIIIPETYKPKLNAKKKKQVVYGEPLDFRGVRYAPINEQGVVYLFGMVSHELGFLIESIRTDFPDCEGKRQLDSKGTKWQNVRIEFEYKSSNFSEHGHDPDLCDLIVCWVHDWEECPVEVLELRSTLKFLPK